MTNITATPSIEQFHYNPETGEIVQRATGPFVMELEGLVGVEGNAPEDSYYEPTTQTFHTIPAKPAEHLEWDWPTKAWIDPRNLDELKAHKWTEFRRLRNVETWAGIDVPGIGRFDSDVASQDNLSKAKNTADVLLQQGSPVAIDWTLEDNTVVTLDYQQVCQVAIAMFTHEQALRSKATTLRAQIEAATTKEEVEAIVW